jgi:hypothetical protein
MSARPKEGGGGAILLQEEQGGRAEARPAVGCRRHPPAPALHDPPRQQGGGPAPADARRGRAALLRLLQAAGCRGAGVVLRGAGRRQDRRLLVPSPARQGRPGPRRLPGGSRCNAPNFAVEFFLFFTRQNSGVTFPFSFSLAKP